MTWGIKQGVTAPGGVTNATRFDVGGTVKYSDALFFNHVIGDGTTQGMLDKDNTILKSINTSFTQLIFMATIWNLPMRSNLTLA